MPRFKAINSTNIVATVTGRDHIAQGIDCGKIEIAKPGPARQITPSFPDLVEAVPRQYRSGIAAVAPVSGASQDACDLKPGVARASDSGDTSNTARKLSSSGR